MRSLPKIVKAFQVSVGDPLILNRTIKASEIFAETETEIGGPVHGFAYERKEKTPSIDEKAIKLKIIQKAQEEADELIAHARKTAKKIIEDARKEIEDMKNVVLEEAKQQGYQAGYDEVAAKAEMLLQEAEEIKAQAIQQYNDTLYQAEPEIIKTVLDISRKIIGDELETRPDKVTQLVRQTLAACVGATSVTVKVSPEDFEAVNENKDLIIRQSRFSGDVAIVKDASLESGGCVVETSVGNIDASAAVQLEALEQSFISILENRE